MGGEREGQPGVWLCAPCQPLTSAHVSSPLLPAPCMQAPIFEMHFFEGFVRPSLHDAYTGWGEALPVRSCSALSGACLACWSGLALL